MATRFETLPGILAYAARNFRNPAQFGYKEKGVWRRISTQEASETVKKAALGLISLGLKPGDRVGIVADPSPFWLMMDLAVLSAGGVTVPMFANIAPENLDYEIKDSGMRFLLVGSLEQVEALRPFFTAVEKVISLPACEGDAIPSWKQLLEMGTASAESQGPELKARLDSLKPDDVATLIYTSGSTGVPKGVEITHRNLCSQVEGAMERFPIDSLDDSALSCLPLAHIFERMIAYYYLSSGVSSYFAEDIKKVGDNLRELHPTIVIMVPRLLEKAFAKFWANVDAATGLKKKLATAALQRAKTKPYLEKPGLKDKIFDAMVYKKLRIAMGGNLRLVISGSAPLDPALYAFFLNIGIPIYEGYGLTEASPVLAANFPGNRKVGTVGKIFPQVEAKIADDGEILGRGPGIMRGYWGKPEETEKAIDGEGWLHTGDLGHIDAEGFLKITGRKKELFKTAGGKYVAPVPIEQAICGCKLVDMAIVIAEGRPFTSALCFPDLESLAAIKQELGKESQSNADFLKSPEAIAYIQKHIDSVNARLNHWEKVQKFALVPTTLSIDANELTPTMKIRRHVVEEKFAPMVNGFYSA
jgi:long-chain acyl-CoA synthetase